MTSRIETDPDVSIRRRDRKFFYSVNRCVIGYAFAINGKVNSADVYASHELFQKLWPKLLESSAVEAFSELQKDKKFAPARQGLVDEA